MLLAIDGNNVAWAGFHAMRQAMGSQGPEELVRAALLGLSQSVLGLAASGGVPPGGRPLAALRVVVCFDEGRPLRRRAIFPAYQTGRESDASFHDNEGHVLAGIAAFSELAEALPLEVVRGVNTEADDLIASVVLSSDGPARIASTDRDFLQLVDDRVSVYSPVKRLVITSENFAEAASPRSSDGTSIVFPRERYLDYRVASGDASDDLPGIPGVGPGSAARMLAYAPLDHYFERPTQVATALGRRNVKIEGAFRSGEAKAVVARNRELMDLRLGATHFPSVAALTVRGSWDEARMRAWLQEQRVQNVDVVAAGRAFARIAGNA